VGVVYMCVLVEVEGAHHLYILFLPDPAELNYIYMNSWKIVFSLTTAHRITSVFKDQEAVKRLSSLHDKYVIVPADKASNNIVFVCKSYYFECLIKELGINNNTSSNTTYKPTSFDKDEILTNHRSFITSLNIPSGKESEDLPYLY
jgi:hypothetical protein